ncbi:hypothetical protein BKA93DRAFT_731783 [Sparassis latifolia]
MGPTRTQKTQHLHTPSSSTPTAGPSNPKAKHGSKPRHKEAHPADNDAIPGVQKIKAALRQTRRLLSKDKLAADVRVATERRQRALEADLKQAGHARKERTLATRYHKIKFFERQKVTRKIQQVKRQLANADGKTKLAKSERRTLEERLRELRVDLNYILHYPKMKKYISLFPPEVRVQGAPTTEGTMKENQSATETDAQREEVRASMRAQMERGELSWEPEVEKNYPRNASEGAVTGKRQNSSGAGGTGKVPIAWHRDRDSGKKGKDSDDAEGGLVSGDAFFGDDDEEDENEASQSEESEDDDMPDDSQH